MCIRDRHKASYKIEDNDNETALFDAVRSTIKNIDNKKSAIRLLIKSGANTKHVNRKNQTLVSIAAKLETPETKAIAKLLK